ncbi:hypothetical protein, partial [Stenotrophomonas geniculata]|uniref:hypothetical protein n=1 Tax=Stenotrophomonas geniculata TaxID=86188 RepID=UPI002E7A31CD
SAPFGVGETSEALAASMRLTPPQPDPPRLRQFPAIFRAGIACSWWVSTLVDTLDPRHARMNSIRFDF